MALLEQLQKNKGTVSSALGKQLAANVLKGNKSILSEAFKLIHYDDKNVRSGAAKIIEKVAESKPELIAPNLSDLSACMNYEESQTRWMVLHVAGLCAMLQPVIARDFFNEAIKYLDKKHGTVLNDRAITYFGYMGAVSKKDFQMVYPYMVECFTAHTNRITRLFEGFEKLAAHMGEKEKKELLPYIEKYIQEGSASEKSWAKKVAKKIK